MYTFIKISDEKMSKEEKNELDRALIESSIQEILKSGIEKINNAKDLEELKAIHAELIEMSEMKNSDHEFNSAQQEKYEDGIWKAYTKKEKELKKLEEN